MSSLLRVEAAWAAAAGTGLATSLTGSGLGASTAAAEAEAEAEADAASCSSLANAWLKKNTQANKEIKRRIAIHEVSGLPSITVNQRQTVVFVPERLRNFRHPMTGNQPVIEGLQQGLFLPASLNRIRATRMESAAGRRRQGRWQVAAQHDFLLALLGIDPGCTG